MNDALEMQISAFIDGELPENESELLVRRLSQDAAMRQQVARYLEIGRLMRQDREVPGMGELRGSIAAALGDEIRFCSAQWRSMMARLHIPSPRLTRFLPTSRTRC